MRKLFNRLIEAATKFESLLALAALLASTGIFAWIASKWDDAMSFGWPAVAIGSLLLAAIFSASFSLVALAISAWRNPRNASASKKADADIGEGPLIVVQDRTFKDETVRIDGHHYINCTFVNCVWLYNGGPFSMSNVNREGTPQVASTDNKIANAITLFKVCGVLHPKGSSTRVEIPKGEE